MLGEKLKELREAKGLVQRQVAAELEVDTAYISKMENNDKPVSRIHLKKLALIYKIKEEQLLPYWIAEKILQVIKNEDFKNDALELVATELRKKGV